MRGVFGLRCAFPGTGTPLSLPSIAMLKGGSHQMNRRELITLLGGTAVAPSMLWPLSARAQQPALPAIQRMQAEAAAAAIGRFIKEIESQLGWTTQLPWTAGNMEQRRFDDLRLLRQVPAILEVAQLDPSGHEKLRLSRLSMNPVAQETDYSQDPKFTEAVAHKVYYGPVYFRGMSEPCMTLALAGPQREAGVSVAEVNLKLIQDLVAEIDVGGGQAYVIDGQGRLIAHRDISLVTSKTDMTSLAQVQAARAAAGANAGRVVIAHDLGGREVLSAYAPVPPLGWLVFVERPTDEAPAPLDEK
jgi:hypothetical protein